MRKHGLFTQDIPIYVMWVSPLLYILWKICTLCDVPKSLMDKWLSFFQGTIYFTQKVIIKYVST